MKGIMKLDKKELREIISCIDFLTNQLRVLGDIYKERDSEYEFGHLNYLIDLRNKIQTYLNKDQ